MIYSGFEPHVLYLLYLAALVRLLTYERYQIYLAGTMIISAFALFQHHLTQTQQRGSSGFGNLLHLLACFLKFEFF